jgi:hypothetical protein
MRVCFGKFCNWGVSKKFCNAVVRCTSFRPCQTGGMSSSLKCVMKSTYLPLRPGNDLMHTWEMCETLNSSSPPSRTISGTFGCIKVVERGRKLLMRNTRCKRTVVGSYNMFMGFPICSSTVKGPSCRSRSFLLRLGIDGIVYILQVHFAVILGTFRIRGLQKHHEIRRYTPDDIIEP